MDRQEIISKETGPRSRHEMVKNTDVFEPEAEYLRERVARQIKAPVSKLESNYAIIDASGHI
jgi:hypothetical protein